MKPLMFNRRNMRKESAAVIAAMALAIAPGLTAQQASSPKIDLAVTYAAARATHTTGDLLWLPSGGGLELNAQFFHGIGLGASATGLHAGSSTPSISSLDLVVLAFGPTYTFRPQRRVSVYSEALAGEANGFHSVFAYGSGPTISSTVGTTTSANSLALLAGGAVDISLSRHLSIRAVHVDYLRTQLPNGGNNTQNNLRLAAGFVAKFGR